MALALFASSGAAEAGGLPWQPLALRAARRLRPRSAAGRPLAGHHARLCGRRRPTSCRCCSGPRTTLGYLSPDTVRRVARWLKLSESDVFGVATFYGQFRFTPPGRHRLRVCLGTACHVKGGVQMLETLERRLQVSAGETTPDGEYDVERVVCLGCCALAPVVTLDDTIYGQMSVLQAAGDAR